MKTAWVLAGGGAAGAIQVGVMKALLEAGHHPDAIYGTSAGALNAFGLSYGGIEDLEKMWRSIRDTPDVLKKNRAVFFKNNMPFFHDETGFYSSEPLRKLLESLSVGRNPIVPFTVCACNIDDLENGKIYADSSIVNRAQILDFTMASASIPGLMEAQVVNGQTLVDGGVIENAPLKRAVDDGAEKIVVIRCLNRKSVATPMFKIKWPILSILGRTLTAMRLETMDNDIQMLLEKNVLAQSKDSKYREIDFSLIDPIEQSLDVFDFNSEKIALGLDEGYALGKRFLELNK